MSSERLMTSWGEYDAAIGRQLSAARHTILIFDRDLQTLNVERPARAEVLAAFLSQPDSRLCIVVQSVQLIRQHGARLLSLLRLHAHHFELVEAPPQLASLNDSMLLVDGESAVIRFHRDQPRSKEIVADPEACSPYLKRYEDIRAEGGTPIGATTLGL